MGKLWIPVGLVGAGLGALVLWPYLWLVRVGVIILLAGWLTYTLTRWLLNLRGVYLEQEKNRRIVNPVEGRLPAWVGADGMAVALESPPLPVGLHLSYSPRSLPGPISVHEETPPLPALPPRRPVAPDWGGAKKDFKRGEIVLGYGQGGPIALPFGVSRSVALVGKSGTGKSNTLRFLLGQFRGQGAEVSIWDGHGDLPGGLNEYPEILADVERIEAIYGGRKTEFKAGRRDFPLFVLVIDEWKAMHRSLKKAKPLVSELITGGRKYNMHLVVASQYFKAEMFEGSGDLDSIWTRYLHWTDSRQAEYARVTDDEATNLLSNLKSYGTVGYAIISHPNVETQILAISRTEASDLA